MLYVMRHGPAEDHSKSGRDFDRHLTTDGRSTVLAAAERLSGSISRSSSLLMPEVVRTSPLVRAGETAKLVAQHLGISEFIEDEQLATDSRPAVSLAKSVFGGPPTLLVGHQPATEALVRILLGQNHAAQLTLPLGFRTAMIAVLVRDGDDCALAALIDPHS